MAGWPPSNEVAVLEINGVKYQDWESVLVKHATQVPMFSARFTCSEDEPIAKNFGVMRIRPGDSCTITLAGELALTGTIYERQVYYDAQSHHVELQAVGAAHVTTVASVTHPTFEWTNTPLEAFVRSVLQPVGINLVVKGAMPAEPRPRINVAPGTTIWQAIDKESKPAAVNYSGDVAGNLVAWPKGSSAGGGDVVVEGGTGPNAIIIGREIIFNQSVYMGAGFAQAPGNNQKWGAQVASVPFFREAQQAASAFGGGTMPNMLIHSEVAAFSQSILQGRTDSERGWNQQDQITVFATVYGWLRPSGGLWGIKQKVGVISPMLIMDGSEDLRAKVITFTQDNTTGTRTTLQLCNELAFGRGFE